MKWTNDVFAELRIREFGVNAQVKQVDLKHIDQKASLNNHARHDKPINDDLIEDYSIAMERGDEFPRVVLAPTANGSFVVLGGNHRIQAAMRIGEKSAPCYVVDSKTPELLDLLPRALNRGHGLRQDRVQALDNACFAVTKYNKTVQQAAEMFGLHKNMIGSELRARKMSELLQSKGVKTHNLNKSILNTLNTIPIESVQVAAARAIGAAQMTINEASGFIRDIKEAKATEASQMAVVAECERRLGNPEFDATTKVKSERGIRTSFLMAVSTMERILKDKKKLHQIGIDDATEKKAISARLDALSKKLHSISHS
jgi:ParB-like chromosome segregation protein Spo0J